jgi:hypothetical protein
MRNAGQISTRRTTRGIVITVLNYELYQGDTGERKPDGTANRTANRTANKTANEIAKKQRTDSDLYNNIGEERLEGEALANARAETPTFSYAPADAGAPKKSGRTPEGGNPLIFKGDPSTSKTKKTPGDPAKVTEMLERIAQGVGLSSWRDLRETEEWKRNHGSQLVELCEKLTPEVFWSRFDEMLEDHAEGWKNPRFVYEDIKAYTNADEELAVLRQASGYIRAISVFPLDPEADPNDKPGKPRVERVYDLPENKIIREAFFVVLPYVEKPDTIGWSEKWQDFKSRGEAYSAVKILEFSKALLASLEKDPAYKKFCSEAWYQKWREKLAATWGW